MTDNEIMNIDEAIKHCYEVANSNSKMSCDDCKSEHKQLAQWLEELKESRETINRQKAEVERLKEECDSKEKAYTEEYCLRKEIKAENEKLREAIISNNLTPTAYKVMKENDEKHIHIINGLKAEVERLKVRNDELNALNKTASIEAIRKFANKVVLLICILGGLDREHSRKLFSEIKNLVKEMVGDE